jgi:dephospho-CoA kinase
LLRLGLTGGMATGKTTVAEMLARRGAHVFYADQAAHELLEPDTEQFREIARRFGKRILGADGRIVRSKLAEAAFGSPGGSRIGELNTILHPPVIAAQRRWREEIEGTDPAAITIVEAALLLEAGEKHDFDKILVVTCRPEQKIARLAKRLNISEAAAQKELERRSAAQWPDESKADEADYVIDNSGTLEHVEQQVDRLWPELKRLAAAV